MKRRLIHIVLLWTIGWNFVACTRYKPITLQEGRALEEQGDYIGARDYYQKMPDPDFREVCLHNLQHLYGEILNAMIAQRDNPDSAETYYALGRAYYEKASLIPEYRDIVLNHGFDTSTYFSEQRDRFQVQAHTALEAATQLHPNYQEALLLEGNLYEDRKESEKAIVTYQQLVELDTESPEAYYRLAMLLHDQGQTKKGLELAVQAITLGPNNPDAHYTLGILYAREESDEWAFAELHQTLCIDPHYLDAYYALSQLFLRQGNFVDAERILRLGFSKDPENLRLSLFYRSLKAISDEKELDEFVAIYKALYGEVVQSLDLEALKDTDFEPSPALEIRYLRFLQNMLRRERPYVFPCADEKEYPYFKIQIARLQEEIEELEQTIQAAEEAAKKAAEEAEKEASPPEEK